MRLELSQSKGAKKKGILGGTQTVYNTTARLILDSEEQATVAEYGLSDTQLKADDEGDDPANALSVYVRGFVLESAHPLGAMYLSGDIVQRVQKFAETLKMYRAFGASFAREFDTAPTTRAGSVVQDV